MLAGCKVLLHGGKRASAAAAWARPGVSAAGTRGAALRAPRDACCALLWSAQDVLVHQQFLDIFIVIVSAGIMHLTYLAFNFAAVL